MYRLNETVDLGDGLTGVVAQVLDDAEIPTFEVRVSEAGKALATATMIALVDTKLVPISAFRLLTQLGDAAPAFGPGEFESAWKRALRAA